MRACESYMDLIQRSIDQETTSQEEAALQEHLSACDGCRALYETYQLMDKKLTATQEEPPEALTGAIMNSIRAEKRQKNSKQWFKRFRFTAIAAVAAVLVLVFGRFSASEPSVRSSTSSAARDSTAAQAEFRAGDTSLAAGPELQKPEAAGIEMEDAAEEVAAETVEEPAAAEPAEVEQDDTLLEAQCENGTVYGTELSEMSEALHAMGCQGDILQVSELSEERLLELFPETVTMILDSGVVLYQVPASDAATAATDGTITVNQIYSDESDSDHCFILLEN